MLAPGRVDAVSSGGSAPPLNIPVETIPGLLVPARFTGADLEDDLRGAPDDVRRVGSNNTF